MNTVSFFTAGYWTGIWAVAMGLLVAQPAAAQLPNRTLQAYVEMGLAQNLTLRRERIAVATAGQQVRQVGGLYQPQVQLGATYTLANGGRTIDFPVGDLLNPAYRALNGLTGTGGFPQLANQSIQLLPNQFQETRVRIIQPLFNTDIYFNYKAQKELLSAQQARQAAYRNTLRHQMEVAYYQYLQAGPAVAVYRTTAQTLTELLRVNQARLAEGLTTNDAVYNTKAQLAGNQRELVTAANRHQLARIQFNYLLNRPLDDSIAVEEPTGTTLAAPVGSTLSALRAATLQQRPELELPSDFNSSQSD